MLDSALELFASEAAERAGLWRRNGDTLASQLYNWNSPQFRFTMIDLDVLACQTAVSVTHCDVRGGRVTYVACSCAGVCAAARSRRVALSVAIPFARLGARCRARCRDSGVAGRVARECVCYVVSSLTVRARAVGAS
jgi:hypothetical protein